MADEQRRRTTLGAGAEPLSGVDVIHAASHAQEAPAQAYEGMTIHAPVGARSAPARAGGRTAAFPRPLPAPRYDARLSTPFWPLMCLFVDAFALAVAVIAIETGERQADLATHSLGWRVAFPFVALALFAMRGAYGPRLRLHILDDLRNVIASTGVAAMAIITLQVLTGAAADASESARLWLLATACVAVGRVGVLRLQATARRRGELRPTLIVGAGRMGNLTARRLLAEPELGLRPVGFLDKDPLSLNGQSVGLPVLGASWDLERVIEQYGIEHVVIAFSTAPHHVLLRVVRRCHELGVAVSVLPRLFEVEGRRVTVERLGALPLVAVHSSNPKGWQFRVKYALDRVIASLLLLLVSPILVTAAAAVLLTMGRPIFFRQPRVGADGRHFDMLKLRTMKGSPTEAGEADIDWAQQQLAAEGDAHEAQTAKAAEPVEATDRRTRVGRVLRHFSIDELPQLWNVVRGDMSLVGPRPERVSYVQRFERSVYRYDDRHRVKSGMTGWAQVHGLRGKTSLSDRVEWDNYYIENWSPWLDVKILLMTLECVLVGQREA
jgi:exopolysaccharide biosynthesis polyprenyl glycosylphosphotransferase